MIVLSNPMLCYQRIGRMKSVGYILGRLVCWGSSTGIVKFALKNRRFSYSRLLLFLGLALCIFSWGLQYKLSLYDPPAAITHQIPKAKLLANEELPRFAEGLRHLGDLPAARVIVHGHFTVLLFLLTFGVLVQSAAALREQSSFVSRHTRDLFSSAIFVRPPPVLG